MCHNIEFNSRHQVKFFFLLNGSTTKAYRLEVNFIVFRSISLPVVFFKALAILKMDTRDRSGKYILSLHRCERKSITFEAIDTLVKSYLP